jgi:hypothetical protein
MSDRQPIRWKVWYLAVLAFLLLQILFYWWFTNKWS